MKGREKEIAIEIFGNEALVDLLIKHFKKLKKIKQIRKGKIKGFIEKYETELKEITPRRNWRVWLMIKVKKFKTKKKIKSIMTDIIDNVVKVDEDKGEIIDRMNKLHYCEISDSFVHPENKLSNGKNGHGESRLFISCSTELMEQLCKKPWKIVFDTNYKSDIKEFIEEKDNFIKKHDHVKKTYENIDKINGENIYIKPQPGPRDYRRNYIGVKYVDNISNREKYTIFRKSLAPTITTLKFYENREYIEVIVSHNKNIKKYNVPHGCSFISLEWLTHLENKEQIEIQHAMNGGEHKERMSNGYFAGVDGFHCCEKHKCCGTKDSPCKWNRTVFEFQGDYWHRNKQEKDKIKKEKYESYGYNVVVMWEHEFMAMKKAMVNN